MRWTGVARSENIGATPHFTPVLFTEDFITLGLEKWRILFYYPKSQFTSRTELLTQEYKKYY